VRSSSALHSSMVCGIFFFVMVAPFCSWLKEKSSRFLYEIAAPIPNDY